MLRRAHRIRRLLVGLPRSYKRLLQVLVDILLVWLALWLAFYLRLGDSERIVPLGGHAWLFILAPLLAIPLYVRSGLYRAVLRYLGSDALLTIFRAVTLSALLLALAIYLRPNPPALVPRSLVFIYWLLSLLMVGGLRLLMRQFFLGDWRASGKVLRFHRHDNLPKVAIYGAGAAGNQLLASLRAGRHMRPVAFIDDDKNIGNRVIAGLRVYRPRRIEQMISDTGATEVLLAMPSASRARRREILTALEKFPLHVRTIPGFVELASGQIRVDDIQEVDIADLLGRDPVAPLPALFERCIRDQVVMVTGAGGSIGSELCRQILSCAPRALLLFEHSEFNLYSIHRELEQVLRREGRDIQLVPLLGNIRDAAHVREVLARWPVSTIYHAAAYKHVPMVEHNVGEGVLNNVFGTLQVAQEAIRAGVANFVLVSTDKAVRPTNVMGCTKRLAELVLQALASEAQPCSYATCSSEQRLENRTRFTMVRFGNVLGSSGSVIPLFREQIRRGGPVTVTHPEITRYFMTIPEAAQLVIQAGSMGQGGDVFVLDMGEPVRIASLAERMIHLSGLSVRSAGNPEGDIAIEFTGLRPGEKLYEELLIGASDEATEHPMILRAREARLPWGQLCEALRRLEVAVQRVDIECVRNILLGCVDGYVPDEKVVDWLAVGAVGRSPEERAR